MQSDIVEIATPISSAKTQIDRIARIEYERNFVKVYFSKGFSIGGERTEEVFDAAEPAILEVTGSIKNAMNVLFSEAFKLRSSQITGVKTDELLVPDYKGFYGELLVTTLFTKTRQKAGQSLEVVSAYMDFGFAVTNGMIGNENPVAMQICLNELLRVLGDELSTSDLSELDELLLKYKIPISRLEPII